MHPFIQQKLPRVLELCRGRHVARLEVFGSAATDRFVSTQSDVDLLVEYLPDAAHGLGGDYFGLKEDLEDLFGCDVDLVMTNAITNPFFLKGISATRMLLYAA